MRFEKAIVTSANKDGKSGIVPLPNVIAIMEEVCTRQSTILCFCY